MKRREKKKGRLKIIVWGKLTLMQRREIGVEGNVSKIQTCLVYFFHKLSSLRQKTGWMFSSNVSIVAPITITDLS